MAEIGTQTSEPGDFDECKSAGGKLTKNADGLMVCTVKGKTFVEKKAFTDQKSANGSTTPTLACAGKKLQKVHFESDGTKAGTKFHVNGEEVKGLAAAHMHFFNDDQPGNVGLHFSTADASDEPGNLNSTSYYSMVPFGNDPAAGAATIAQVPVVASVMPRTNRKDLYRQI